ncbi:TetR/AcrR family transcriptional regulator [Luteimicrobium sp. DT211]|uniref:TetR/AcrR family transcriptional regulator n=1 Tax=Luteimicrobium sp. DT211 TaxID=3393412 RepID=UPI003CED7602
MSATTQSSSPEAPPEPTTETAANTDGRSTRWDDHRAARRAALVNATRKAVHRKGSDVSMEEIAAFAGTSKSIIYRYFEDKVGLQIAVGAQVVAEIRDALDQALHSAESLRDGIAAMVDTYLAMIEHSPNVYYFVTRTGSIIGSDAGPRITGDGRPPLTTFVDEIDELMRVPAVRELGLDEVAAAAWATGQSSFVRGTGEWWLAHRGRPGIPDRDALAEQVTTWLWEGVTAASRAASRPKSPAKES